MNKGDARASDVVALMEHIQDMVFDRFAVSLEPEVIIIGQEAGSQELL